MEQAQSFNLILENVIKENWNRYSLSDYGENNFQYKDVARIIEKIHIVFKESGIAPGDKIALCGKNSSRWGISFFACLTYGAVAVPILHEFHPEQIHQIVNHSESKLLFVDDKIYKNLTEQEMPALSGIVCLKDFSILLSRDKKLSNAREHLNELFGKKFPERFSPEDVHYYKDSPEELAVINYTSGTTSNSKGVMIPYRAVWSNREFAKDVLSKHLKAGDQILAMLPMAHMYGMAFEFIFEFCQGVHVNFLTKAPTPQILLSALKDIKPGLIVAVPLIIEKIVRKAILPKVKDPKVALLLKVPVLGDMIREKVRKGLSEALGGRFYEVIIGGAALSQEVEEVLHDIGFNYTVGYGATECAPILAYRDWKTYVPRSCGQTAPRMELKIDSPDPENVPGEILARGMNVMQGYYKNPEETKKTLIDGWYHTGDLAVMDADGNVFIKGRSKNMLLGANGQNIYPEEIEDKLSTLPLVAECVVIQKGEKIYGLVYPDPDKVKELGLSADNVKDVMDENRKLLNTQIPAYEQLAGIKVMDREFEKTPKKSIKRYLYTNEEI
ncbi:MAG: AMP-binding protein [Bacteroidaceae bacterium]|nr:AMP-binding protein [Bacteroidaceae bacterium]